MRIRMVKTLFGMAAGLFALLTLACQSPLAAPELSAPADAGSSRAVANAGNFTANVMAPLKVWDSEWANFENQLATVKGYGVDAVSVDVWWGDVEGAADNSFNWGYYDTMFAKIKAKGLKIVPILSFHQCGGNVGDNYTSLLPSWIWTKYAGRTLNGITLTADDLKYKSEQGNYARETVQLWADSLVLGEYADFAAAFKDHFAGYAADFQEINVSLGPAGELRYPSYNSHDSGSGYPTRGALQSYSRLAVKDFQDKMMAKYGTIAAVNAAWGTALTAASQIQPPANAGSFFSNGDYRNLRYGKDFIDWYNQSLADHGKNMIQTVVNAFGTSFPAVAIGYKIPGVHWAMENPSYPRAAEVAAGLIQTSVDFNSATTGFGYQKMVGVAKSVATGGRPMVLHFTCLEMDNQNWAPQYSRAKDLVFWVANEAARQGVTIKGENALSGGVTGNAGWDLINNAFDYASYTGLTVLRVGEVASGTAASRYQSFITKYRGSQTGWPTLYIRGTNNAWGLTAATKSGDVWTASNVSFGSTATERFKFDVKGDWTQNYGKGSTAGVAVAGGADIPVSANTSYTISINEKTLAYTLTPNSQTWSVSGTIGGDVKAGVTVTVGGKSATSDANGAWTVAGLANGSYTATPAMAGYTFTPSSKAVSVGGANVTGVAFTAARIPTTGVTIHFREWQSATTYYVHAWDGLDGDFAMSYEGQFNGYHWWKVTLSAAPANFKFCFKNSNNTWDGVNRQYSNQAKDVYVKYNDATVYTTRP